jgi:hypothetical protein
VIFFRYCLFRTLKSNIYTCSKARHNPWDIRALETTHIPSNNNNCSRGSPMIIIQKTCGAKRNPRVLYILMINLINLANPWLRYTQEYVRLFATLDRYYPIFWALIWLECSCGIWAIGRIIERFKYRTSTLGTRTLSILIDRYSKYRIMTLILNYEYSSIYIRKHLDSMHRPKRPEPLQISIHWFPLMWFPLWKSNLGYLKIRSIKKRMPTVFTSRLWTENQKTLVSY